MPQRAIPAPQNGTTQRTPLPQQQREPCSESVPWYSFAHAMHVQVNMELPGIFQTFKSPALRGNNIAKELATYIFRHISKTVV